MELSEIIAQMRNNGLDRQATLLESRFAESYIAALTRPQWKSHVTEAIGADAYQELQYSVHATIFRNHILKRNTIAESSMGKFQPRACFQEPLDIRVDRTLSAVDIEKATSLGTRLADLAMVAEKIAFQDLQRAADTDPNLLYRVFKDDDDLQKVDVDKYYDKGVRGWKNKLRTWTTWRDPHDVVYFNMLKSAQEAKRYLPIDSPFLPQDDHKPQFTEELKETIQQGAEKMLDMAEHVLKDPVYRKKQFDAWLAYMKETEHDRVITNAKTAIRWRIEPETDTTNLWPLQDINNYKNGYEQDDDAQPFDFDARKPVAEQILHTPIHFRRMLITDLDLELTLMRDTVIGLQQILAGGPITNPNVDPLSIRQNHGRLPNIRYSQAVLDEMGAIRQEMQRALDDMPDLTDLPVPSRYRNKRDHTYSIEELPKDPLDVTFGNDAQCCIFVPENVEKLVNGYTVGQWLADPCIRLFAFFKHEKQRKLRMGLVPTFDTYIQGRKEEILTCNSLELSRIGIVGGLKTVEALVEYGEDWMIAYAKAAGYKGATMGRHAYNTSQNFSQRAGDVVEEGLLFEGKARNFYSDIFVHDKDGAKTRPGSCYWLWKGF